MSNKVKCGAFRADSKTMNALDHLLPHPPVRPPVIVPDDLLDTVLDAIAEIKANGHQDVRVQNPNDFDRQDGFRVFASKFWFDKPRHRCAFVTLAGEILWMDEKANRLACQRRD